MRPTSPQLSFQTVPPRRDNVNHDVDKRHDVPAPAGYKLEKKVRLEFDHVSNVVW